MRLSDDASTAFILPLRKKRLLALRSEVQSCRDSPLGTISRRGVLFLLALRRNASMADKPSDLVQGTLDMLNSENAGSGANAWV